MRYWLIAAASAITILVASGCGGANPGEKCAKRLVGGDVCGDDLVAFCRERYDPQVNGATCREVLVDAGLDPEEVARQVADAQQEQIDESIAQDQRRERERVADEREANRRDLTLGQTAVDDGVGFTVRRMSRTRVIAGEYDSATAKAGRVFVGFDVHYSNRGRQPIDILCSVTAAGTGFTLIDSSGREYGPNSRAMTTAPANEDACGEGLQPGDSGDAKIVFQVKPSIEPHHLLVWNPDKPGPDEGGTHIDILLP